MTIQEIKTSFHHLIDEIENEELLKRVYNLLKDYPKEKETEDFWDTLTNKQKEDIDAALKESEDEDNYISHDEVKKEAKKWLNK